MEQLPHFIRSHRYGHRLMPLPEFQTREQITSLRRSLPRAGAMARLCSNAVSMRLSNRLKVEFQFDADGFIASADLDSVMVLLIELHALVRAVDSALSLAELRDWMKLTVGGGYGFPPSRQRARRPMKPRCWWYEYGENNVH